MAIGLDTNLNIAKYQESFLCVGVGISQSCQVLPEVSELYFLQFLSITSSLQQLGPEVRPVIAWPLPQALSNHCPSTSYREDRLGWKVLWLSWYSITSSGSLDWLLKISGSHHPLYFLFLRSRIILVPRSFHCTHQASTSPPKYPPILHSGESHTLTFILLNYSIRCLLWLFQFCRYC